jgi:hypothetical protein
LTALALLMPLAGQSVYPGYGRGTYGSGAKRNPGTLPDEPLATFRGVVQGAGPKLLVVKTETDTVDFECSKKTTFQRGANKVKAADVKNGDPVAVEARHTIDGKVMAVNVTLDPPPEKPPAASSGTAQR